MTQQADRGTQLVGASMAVVAAIAFSAKAIMVKLAYRHGVDAVTLLALRMLFAAPLFVFLAIWSSTRKGVARLHRKDAWKIFGVGLLGYYAASFFDFLGLQYITAALERLVLFIYPTFVLLYAATFAGRSLSRRDVFALVASYVGIVLVFFNDLTTQQTNVVLGTFWVVLSALSYAAYLIGSGHMLQRIGSVRFASLASLAACAGVMVHFALVQDLALLVDQPPAVHGWALLMGTVSTVFPVVLTSAAIRRLGAGKVAMIGTLGPVVTIFLGYALLDEPITAIQLGGAALVTAGVLTIGLATRRAPSRVSADGG